MLGTVLGNLQRKIAGVHNFLLYAGDFVSEDQGVFPAGLPAEAVQFHGMDRLFYGHYCVAIGLQVYYSALVGAISPEEFDGTFVNAWDVYSSSVRDWLN